MDIKECIKFANENPICFVATCDHGRPRVRCMGFWFADETGFYFQTGTMKEIVEQIRTNPNIEVCFYKPSEFIGETMRVRGEAEFVTDEDLKRKVIADRPFLKQFGLDFDSPQLVIFRIARGNAHFWNLNINLATKELIYFGDNE
jgi:uncharacterized pyridoxamine 5'-phosphate oxidase family protein